MKKIQDASARGRSNRNRGAVFERLIVRKLQDAGIACERNIAQSRSASREGCDIEGTDWWIECGTGATVNPRAKFDQGCRDNASDDRPVVAITRRGRGDVLATVGITGDVFGPFPVVVTMSLEDWIRIAKAKAAADTMATKERETV